MTAEMLETIKQQSKAQATPSQILTSMRLQDKECILKKKDIYNAKQSIRRKALGPLSPIQYLLEALNDDNWFYKYETTPISRELTHLFFIEKNTADILRKNSEVLLMDCTYKTNKYKLPLLVIVGHTALGTTFYVGFAFLANEREADYQWVLQALHTYLTEMSISFPTVVVTDRDLALINALATVFPLVSHLLCVWHVNKNVLAYCKPSFVTKEAWDKFYAAWQTVVYANTSEIFDSTWSKLQNDYIVEYLDVVDYLNDTWIRPFVRQLVRFHTNKVRHFFTSTTSRSEGANRVLKQQLGFSTGDLKLVVENIEVLLMNQRKEHAVRIDSAKMRVPFDLQIPLFRGLISKVSIFHASILSYQYY